MARNSCTLLIVPWKKTSIKQISVPGTLVKFAALLLVFIFCSIACFSYDYVRVKKENVEFTNLKRLTTIQKKQINFLVEKIGKFEKKMAGLERLDKKIRVMTNLERNYDNDQIFGVGGPIPEEDNTESQEVMINNIRQNIDRLLEDATSREKSFEELLGFLRRQKSILASTPSIWPVRGWVTSEYGYRISSFTGKREFHRGIDIATRIGQEVEAPADGIVITVCRKSFMGNYIKIDHGHDITTHFGHLMKSSVRIGKRVKRGDIIGYIGNSGRSTGPHLHYAVFVKGISVNPRRYLF